MNNLHFNFDLATIAVNTVLRLITAGIFLALIIPLQIKESKVKNGLRKLRIQLLASGVILFLINTVGLFVLIFKYLYTEDIVEIVTTVITYFNSLGFLAVALIKYNIYHESYSDKSKEMHKKIDRLERKENSV